MTATNYRGRIEPREYRIIAVQLISGKQPELPQLTFTQNISGRGARIHTRRLWAPQSVVAVASLSGDFSSTGRVTYCQQITLHEFAIGVEFHCPSGSWVLSPLAAPGAHIHVEETPQAPDPDCRR